MLSRRSVLLAVGGSVHEGAWARAGANLTSVVRSRLLHPVYARDPGGAPEPNGLAGLNKGGFRIIEEQRQGTEWIVHGVASGRHDWISEGWRLLDVGINYQQPDGGFGRFGYFHSNALFAEALARACLLDPPGASRDRRLALHRLMEWIDRNSSAGELENAPYTHRYYILAAACGEAAAVLSTSDATGAAWASKGIARQTFEGINPELGGYDVSYQAAGVLSALRYLTTCSDGALRSSVARMVNRALDWEVARLDERGNLSVGASTRMGKETFGGELKAPNYRELFEALAYASILVNPKWRPYAIKILEGRHPV